VADNAAIAALRRVPWRPAHPFGGEIGIRARHGRGYADRPDRMGAFDASVQADFYAAALI
jgi:hypothetical protein